MRIDLSLSALVLAGLTSPSSAQSTSLLSVGPGGGPGNGNSRFVSISADGRYVAFGSSASDLVSGDANGVDDVFLRNRRNGTTVRVSVDSSGVEGNGGSYAPSVSADGRYVAFQSYASNLVAGDTNGICDVFVRDRTTGTTVRVSVDSAGLEATGESFYPAISADGRYVAFQSLAATLVAGDVNGKGDVFVRDLSSGTTVLVSQSSAGMQGDADSQAASISADGRFVVFDSTSASFSAGDANGASDVFVRDLVAGTTERVSVDPAGNDGNGNSFAGSLSADGRHVAFYSAASNLVGLDANNAFDVYVRDLQAATTTRVSVTPVDRPGNGDSFTPSISADGRFVAFQSIASNLVAGDTNATADVFLRDCDVAVTLRASVGAHGAESDDLSAGPAVSADGRDVAFWSAATNLAGMDGNGCLDVFLFDRECTGVDPSMPFCFGDGSAMSCPCANGAAGRGCANSAVASGAWLRAGGSTAINAVTGTDSIVLCVDDVPAGAVTLLLQTTMQTTPVTFGDGLRCAGGAQRMISMGGAPEGRVVYPQPGQLSVSRRSAALGDPIAGTGATRFYQAAYREPDASFCPPPLGGSVNITNALALVW
jgi:Tol biopolymer transport system component